MGRKPKRGLLVEAWPRLVIHVPPTRMARLKDRALRHGMTLSRYVNELIERDEKEANADA